MKLVLFPLKGGNVQSLKRAFQKLGCNAHIATSINELQEATHIVIPGIGSFEKAIETLESNQWKKALIAKINEEQTYTLGICLGMQLLAESSEESTSQEIVKGLQIVPGTVIRFTTNNPENFKIPHNGWNTVQFEHSDPLLEGLHENDYFFFLHAYHYSNNIDNYKIGTTTYDKQFPSIIKKGRCYGVQFHPEKSHDAGLKLLQNFINLK